MPENDKKIKLLLPLLLGIFLIILGIAIRNPVIAWAETTSYADSSIGYFDIYLYDEEANDTYGYRIYVDYSEDFTRQNIGAIAEGGISYYSAPSYSVAPIPGFTFNQEHIPQVSSDIIGQDIPDGSGHCRNVLFKIEIPAFLDSSSSNNTLNAVKDANINSSAFENGNYVLYGVYAINATGVLICDLADGVEYWNNFEYCNFNVRFIPNYNIHSLYIRERFENADGSFSNWSQYRAVSSANRFGQLTMNEIVANDTYESISAINYSNPGSDQYRDLTYIRKKHKLYIDYNNGQASSSAIDMSKSISSSDSSLTLNLRVGESVTLPLLTRTGYSFAGWDIINCSDSAANSGSDSAGNPGSSSASNSNLSSNPDSANGNTRSDISFTMGTVNTSIKARWEAISYTVQFNPNKPAAASSDVSGSMPTLNCRYDKTEVLPDNQYKIIGWTFVGWNNKSDGSGTYYDNKSIIENLTSRNNEKIDLYAIWRENTYTLKLEPGGGVLNSDIDENIELSYEDSTTLPTDIFRPGYTFSGWNSEEDGTGTDYTNETLQHLSSDNLDLITVYAIWQKKKCVTLEIKSDNYGDNLTNPYADIIDTDWYNSKNEDRSWEILSYTVTKDYVRISSDNSDGRI